jgi:hypothetical protein
VVQELHHGIAFQRVALHHCKGHDMPPLHLGRAGTTVGLLVSACFISACFVNAYPTCRGATPQPLSEASVVRSWTDSTGKFHMEGTLLDSDQSQVRLQKVQGPVITVALARLSAEDQRFVLNSLKSPVAHAIRSAPIAADKLGRAASNSTQAGSSSNPTGWWDGLQAGWASMTTPSLRDAISVASAGPLILQSAQTMPRNMIYVRLSRQFLQRMALHDLSQRAAVNDTVLGAKVVGVSQTVGSTEFELQPSDSYGSAEIHLFGTNTYNTVADAGPIQVFTNGVTRFASAVCIG